MSFLSIAPYVSSGGSWELYCTRYSNVEKWKRERHTYRLLNGRYQVLTFVVSQFVLIEIFRSFPRPSNKGLDCKTSVKRIFFSKISQIQHSSISSNLTLCSLKHVTVGHAVLPFHLLQPCSWFYSNYRMWSGSVSKKRRFLILSDVCLWP